MPTSQASSTGRGTAGVSGCSTRQCDQRQPSACRADCVHRRCCPATTRFDVKDHPAADECAWRICVMRFGVRAMMAVGTMVMRCREEGRSP